MIPFWLIWKQHTQYINNCVVLQAEKKVRFFFLLFFFRSRLWWCVVLFFKSFIKYLNVFWNVEFEEDWRLTSGERDKIKVKMARSACFFKCSSIFRWLLYWFQRILISKRYFVVFVVKTAQKYKNNLRKYLIIKISQEFKARVSELLTELWFYTSKGTI